MSNQNHNVKNQKTTKSRMIIIGIIIVIMSIRVHSFAICSFGIIWLIAVCLTKANGTDTKTFVSGETKSMTKNDSRIESGKIDTSVQKKKSYSEDEQNNSCPVCKKLSYNGYCSDCGYYFR